ncbi:MAG: ATP-binding protein [Dehalococcoidia bacterium]|nr:ATP-binding protein [Dehalococcoidia bacterium]
MDKNEAREIVESLRFGIPPNGYVRYFTVGREEEVSQLLHRLEDRVKGPLLLKANWGAGKSHLLLLVRETALDQGFLVSYVKCDSASGVRFNRLDQIFGAVCRGIELPYGQKANGIRAFLNYICTYIKQENPNGSFWRNLTDNGQWRYSDELTSYACYLALRGWYFGNANIQNIIEDWLFHPWKYKAERKSLYINLVSNLSSHFRDKMPEWQYYDTSEGIFDFQGQDYLQCWASLTDLFRLSKESGLKGFVILFDEFEEQIERLKNIKYQEKAFLNLFELYKAKKFVGMTFFAVTPDFTHNCQKRLTQKGRIDFNLNQFNELPTFEMAPLELTQLEELSHKILDTHAIAFGWNPQGEISSVDLSAEIDELASVQIPNRTRHFITEFTKYLDEIYDGHH